MLNKRIENPLNLFHNFGKEFNDLSKWIDEVFHFHGLPTVKGIDSPMISPSLDFIEKEKEFVLNIEVPGIEKENIEISINDNTLIIKGEKKYEKTEKNEEIHLNERYYGSFRREIGLPSNCNENKIDASYKDGILSIYLPKMKEEKKEIKKIEIK